MALIIPFKAIRPVKDKVHLVSSRSIDSYNTADLNYKLKSNPYTFLRIIKPEFDQPVKSNPNSPELLHKIKDRFTSFIRAGFFEKEETACLYIYNQQKPGASYSGIIGCSAIDDYINGTIKIHEQTITDREEKLMHYLEICDFNAEPVLMCHPYHEGIDQMIIQIQQETPFYDFTTTDMVRHKVWRIQNTIQIERIQQYYNEVGNVYIADGHHRSASSTLLGKIKRKRNKDYKGDEPFNFFLSAYFSETQLHIYDFNRVVKDLNNMYEEDFLDKLNEKFEVVCMDEKIYYPVARHNISMYMGGYWYSLTFKKEFINNNDPVGQLDAAILTDHVLSPILGIHDLKTDSRIIFVNGIKGLEELKRHVDGGKMKVAFALYPVDMIQLKEVADANGIMPPKTTYIEPKLRSGLLVYPLS